MKPYAIFHGVQKNPYGEDIPLYTIYNGDRDKSMVSLETLKREGIEVRNESAHLLPLSPNEGAVTKHLVKHQCKVRRQTHKKHT